MITLDLSILNQKGTPMFNSDLTANRPAAGIVGRIFIATDSPYGIFRDTGSAWDAIAVGSSTFSGSLATGQVAFGSATNTISGSNNLFWDNANLRLGINNSTPISTIDANGEIISRNLSNPSVQLKLIVVGSNPTIQAVNPSGGSLSLLAANTSYSFQANEFGSGNYSSLRSNRTTSHFAIINGASSTFGIAFYINNATSGASLFISGAGNTIVGNNLTDTGQRFQVTGTALITGNLQLNSSIFNSLGNAVFEPSASGLTFNSGATSSYMRFLPYLAATFSLYMFPNGNVAINTLNTDTGAKFQVNGTSYFSGNIGIGTAPVSSSSIRSVASTSSISYENITIDSLVNSTTTGSYTGIAIYSNTANAAFSTYIQGIEIKNAVKGAASTIVEQYGILIRDLTSGNANYGILSQISASGSSRFNLYVTGTAPNFFNGNLALGSVAAISNRLVSNRLNLTGGTLSIGYELESSIQNDVTSECRGFSSYLGKGGASTLNNIYHFVAGAVTTFGGVVTSQTGFRADASLIGATNNYGFYGEIPSGSNRWNLFMNSAALNYLGGNLLIKTTTDTGYAAQITSAFGDSQLNVWGATAPSIRLDNAASGATRRFVIGLSTATNNFIQGAVSGDICISTASASPLLFGMWQTTSAAEVMRISTALNLQIGSITDTGEKLQLTGSIRVNGQRSATAGGASGQHLIINCDGVSYKIALLNP